MIDFKLIPVDEKPISNKKKREKKFKVDEDEIKFLQTEFPGVYGADYIQELYKRLGEKKK